MSSCGLPLSPSAISPMRFCPLAPTGAVRPTHSPAAAGLTNTLTMSVINTGDLPLNGSAVVGAPFALVSGSPYSVAAGQTGAVTVSFLPVMAGVFNDNVIFTSNGGGSTNPVTGTGLTPGR